MLAASISHSDPKRSLAIPQRSSPLCAIPFVRKHGRYWAVKRREFIMLLGGAATWPLVAGAQQAGIWRIGLLETSSPSPARRLLWEALRQRLRELGYLEGQNIVFESRFEGKSDRLSAGAAELVGLKVDVIVTSGTPAAL